MRTVPLLIVLALLPACVTDQDMEALADAKVSADAAARKADADARAAIEQKADAELAMLRAQAEADLADQQRAEAQAEANAARANGDLVLAEAKEAEARLAKARAETKMLLAEAKAAESRTAALVAAARRAEEELARADALRAETILDDPTGFQTVEGVGGVVAPFAGTFAPIVTAVTGLLVGLLRANQNKRKAVAIAKAIEKQKAKAGNVVNFNDPTVKAELTADMGAGAAKLVDEGQGKTTTLPI